MQQIEDQVIDLSPRSEPGFFTKLEENQTAGPFNLSITALKESAK